MRYILLTLILLLTITGCSRKPGTVHKAKSYPKKSAQKQTPKTTNTTSKKSSKTLDRLYTQYRGWKGAPYQYGGMSKGGVDCSGFVHRTYQKLFHIKLPRSTKDQVKKGKRVYINQLRAGDLVFFKTGWNVRHVGIYLEKGKFVHASSSKGVIISSMYTGYWKENYWQARRLI